jgi:hypothetical protein
MNMHFYWGHMRKPHGLTPAYLPELLCFPLQSSTHSVRINVGSNNVRYWQASWAGSHGKEETGRGNNIPIIHRNSSCHLSRMPSDNLRFRSKQHLWPQHCYTTPHDKYIYLNLKPKVDNYYVILCVQREQKNVTIYQYGPYTYLSMLVIPEPKLSRNVRQAPWT